MSDRCFASFCALTIVVAVGSLGPVSVAGQTRAGAATAGKTAATKTWTPPLTPWGQPDLQGVWLNNSATPLERPKALEGRQFLTDDEVAELKQRAARLFKNGNSDYAGGDNAFLATLAPNLDQYKNPAGATCSSVAMIEREFDRRTSLIVDPPDGKIPPLTPAARQKRAAAEAATGRLPEGPEDLGDAIRCITFGVPRLAGNFGPGIYGYYQILQSPGYVVLVMESMHDARIIPLDGRPHPPRSMRQWNGDSRGHWEGKTLIADTTNFSLKSHPTGSFSAISNFMESSENLHLVERFTRVAPDAINYEMTLDDPTNWTKSWTAAIRLKQTQDELYEFACHEESRSMVGILAGARAEEKAAEEAAKAGAK